MTDDARREHRYAVILAGGRGSRLWPASTESLPKQFMRLDGPHTLIEQTFDRLAGVVGPERVLVSTTREYAADVARALPRLAPANVVVEPSAQGKPAAFELFCLHLTALDPDCVVLVAAADSSVAPVEAFQAGCADALRFVEEHRSWTVMMGAVPVRPDVSLGYVHALGTAEDVDGFRVAREFIEKPALVDAERYVASGDYFWNTSTYCFAPDELLAAYRAAAPRMYVAVETFARTGDPADYQAGESPGHELYPLVGQARPIAVLECRFRWHDIGTWPSLYRALRDQGQPEVISRGSGHVDIESEGLLVVNDTTATVVTTGLKDIVVVVVDGHVLVAPLDALEDQHGAISRLRAQAAARPMTHAPHDDEPNAGGPSR